MDRTHLSLKAGAKLVEYPRRLQQNSPEALGKLRIVRLVHDIFQERNGLSDLNGYRPNGHGRAETLQRGHHSLIERSNSHRFQGDCAARSFVRLKKQLMLQEVKVDLQ
jgi:hypothetical protein